jgi:Ca-activated chloride channel family protein
MSLVFLSARPYQNKPQENINAGVDIVISLDQSLSMLEEDFEPNRYVAATQVINEFVNGLQYDRVGLVIFSGETYTLSPLTFDYSLITNSLSDVNPENISRYISLPGTAIGDAIISSTLKFQENEERSKVIILFTDGVANQGIDPLEAASYAASRGVKVYSIYIGNPNDYLTFQSGEYGEGETTLKAVSKISNGKFYSAKSSSSLRDIIADISELEKTEIKTETKNIQVDTPNQLIYISSVTFFLLMISLTLKKYLK